MNVTARIHRINGLYLRLAAAARDEKGQGLAEYAFILSLVVIGLIVIVSVIGKQDSHMWSNVENGFTGH